MDLRHYGDVGSRSLCNRGASRNPNTIANMFRVVASVLYIEIHQGPCGGQRITRLASLSLENVEQYNLASSGSLSRMYYLHGSVTSNSNFNTELKSNILTNIYVLECVSSIIIPL